METLAISELITALTDAGVGPDTLILAVGGAFAYKYFKGNGFAKESHLKALGKSLDRMRDESIAARAEMNSKVSELRKDLTETQRQVAVLDDRSRNGRCASGDKL